MKYVRSNDLFLVYVRSNTLEHLTLSHCLTSDVKILRRRQGRNPVCGHCMEPLLARIHEHSDYMDIIDVTSEIY